MAVVLGDLTYTLIVIDKSCYSQSEKSIVHICCD
jgi:hypothetical protein